MISKMNNCRILIDAGYLSLISKFLGKGKHLKFDINKFARNLAKKEQLDVKEIIYYTAPPYESPKPTELEIKRKTRYDKFISKLRKLPSFIVKEGRCQKIDNIFQQKGVDTLRIMDLMRIAYEKDVKNIVLVACDTDFVPILNEVRNKGIRIILYYFTDFDRKSRFFMSNHILTACDKKVLLRKEDFEDSPLD